MELANERSFTIVDPNEMCTMAFVINEPEGNTSCATIQKLECKTEESASGYKKTFFVSKDDLNNDERDYDILLLTLGKEKALMNMAILKKDELLISKEPANVSYKTLRTEDSITYKDINYTPNFKRPISIIDPEIADEAKPVLYFDEAANMVRARVKLLPDKSYIALEVRKKETGGYKTNYTVCTFE